MPLPSPSEYRRLLEERAERIRAEFRANPQINELLLASQEDEREGRYISHEEMLRRYGAEE